MKLAIAILCMSSLLFASGLITAVVDTNKVVYPVAVRIYGEFVIVGGLADGKWVSARQIEKSLPSNMNFRLFSATQRIGDGTGQRNANSELQNYITLPVIRIKPNTETRRRIGYANVAVGGDWNVMPRKVEKGLANDKDRHQVKKYLAQKGIVTNAPDIDLVLHADLDGDGSVESIVTGSHYQTSEYGPPEPRIGDYSYVVVISDSKHQTLEGSFFTNVDSLQEKEWTIHRVVGIADVDSDKVMEIAIVTEEFEGGDTTLTKIRNNKIQRLQITGK